MKKSMPRQSKTFSLTANLLIRPKSSGTFGVTGTDQSWEMSVRDGRSRHCVADPARLLAFQFRARRWAWKVTGEFYKKDYSSHLVRTRLDVRCYIICRGLVRSWIQLHFQVA
ncbi:hypothetical protein V1508DRAFT_427250 [Lipomyces doorenjongii]|uniref:uncharacterized protein n=1 Tax=Lipomyces doorenjongii TaxID=383834 RepID=UPI0034CD35E8